MNDYTFEEQVNYFGREIYKLRTISATDKNEAIEIEEKAIKELNEKYKDIRITNYTLLGE